jgi:hypothetical protein
MVLPPEEPRARAALGPVQFPGSGLPFGPPAGLGKED